MISNNEIEKLNADLKKLEALESIWDVIIAHRMINNLRKAGVSEEKVKEFEKKLRVSVKEVNFEEIKSES